MTQLPIVNRSQHPLRNKRGGILIATLAFVIMISVILAGMGSIVISHFGRAATSAEYAAAIALTDAGLNNELRLMNLNINNQGAWIPTSGSIAQGTSDGTFQASQAPKTNNLN